MREPQREIERAYAGALRGYLAGEGEAALVRAYQMGRDALTADLGVLDLARVQQQALVDLLGELPAQEHAHAARAAAEFFGEALAAFEMSQRGLRGRLEEHERLERLKNQFVSVVSHELRTPLTSIHGALDLVVEGKAGTLPAQARSLLEIAHRNSQRLVRLANEILDIQRLESGEIGVEARPVELAPLLAGAVEANQAYAGRFDVRIALDGEPPAVQVRADPDRCLQVLANLLCNAARFSPAGEIVFVRAVRLPGFVRVSVSDRGPGIPEEFRERIFQPFAQAEPSPPNQREGSGLGLSISKAICERLGGRIGFESEVGRGSTFHFDLPEWRDAGAPSGDAPR